MSGDGKDKRDDFWSIDKLVPRKKKITAFATRSGVVDYSDSAYSPREDAAERKLTFENVRTVRADEEYSPEKNALIKKVKIKHRLDRFDFYDNFRKAATLFFDFKGKKCDFVRFYSYMPQYSQLNEQQKAYYFFWRSEVREGRFPKTDYSYLYLYAFEIFNLPELVPPRQGIDLLVSLWRAYRRELPRIDPIFSVWVQDYCLVHKLDCPMKEIADFIFDIIPLTQFREFYLYEWEEAGAKGITGLIGYLSDYDYRKGKYSGGNPDADEQRRAHQAELYRIHMDNALRLIIKEGGVLSELSSPERVTSSLVRDAFANSICTHSVKCTLEIEYFSLADSSAMKEGVTAALKYAENRMRGIMGVKSRLSVKGMPDKYRSILEPYFNALESRERAAAHREEVPEYEKLYSAPKEKLSLENADAIEAISWETTARLVEAADDDLELEPVPELRDKKSADVTADKTSPSANIDEKDGRAEYLCYLLDPGMLSDPYTPPSGFEEDMLADGINEAFTELIGDVVLERTHAGYKIIEDYREDVYQWLQKLHR